MLLKAVAGYHTSFLITLAIASHILAHSSSHSGPAFYIQTITLTK